MLRFWNRLVSMNRNRLTRTIFDWDKTKNGWCKQVKTLLSLIDYPSVFTLEQPVDLQQAGNLLHTRFCESWEQDVINVPKLRSFITLKHEYGTEPFLKLHNRGYRSVIAQFRCGILPLSIETGRFNGIPLEFRLCVFCSENTVEDEFHFLLDCSFYTDLRQALLTKARSILRDFDGLHNADKVQFLMSHEIINDTAKFMYNALHKRRSALYQN